MLSMIGFISMFWSVTLPAQDMFQTSDLPELACDPLIGNIEGRKTQSLNGTWNAMIDPVKDNFFASRFTDALVNNMQPAAGQLLEFNLDHGTTLKVPGDWNTQDERLFFYNGKVWYKRSFHAHKVSDKRYFLYFGAINYQAHIYVNGKQVASHRGGYTSFNCEVTEVLKEGENLVVIQVDNTLGNDDIPTTRTDWMNYGGITRDVYLAELPAGFIQNYKIQLSPGKIDQISGWAKIDGATEGTVTLRIPGLGVEASFPVTDGWAAIEIQASPQLWSPEAPILYDVELSYGEETIKDQIGFRSLAVEGGQVLLNSQPVFLKGISIHEEAIGTDGRAYSYQHAWELLQKAKELGCNFVRLAHYTHNENMLKVADHLGLLVWSEIPVYWNLQFEKPEILETAKVRMEEMIHRDQNRASIMFWSLGNETPVSEARNHFFQALNDHVKMLDATRLTTAALVFGGEEIQAVAKEYYFPSLGGASFEQWDIHIKDPLAAIVDVAAVNQYFGWYYSGFLASSTGVSPVVARQVMLDNMPKIRFHVPAGKPFVFSELGAGAKKGLRADAAEMLIFSEDYQALVYEKQIEMVKNQQGLVGLSPWILKDFRSTLRQHQGIQDYWNRKGLISDNGEPKKAFFVLQDFYK